MRGHKTRNAGTMTEAAYFSKIRSGLRKAFQWWEPIRRCKLAARTPYIGDSKQRKWSFECAHCHKLFKGQETNVDHVVPLGSLNSLDDLPGFIGRLTAEEETAYQLLCKPCHQIKTNNERAKR